MVDTYQMKTGQFSIRIRKGNWEFEVSAPSEEFVLRESERIIQQLQINNSLEAEEVPEAGKISVELSQNRPAKPETLGEFFRQFKPQTHLDRILILGYWCEIKQGQSNFSADDILNKYKEVREPPPANIRRDLSSLQGKGFLLSAGKTEGAVYSLTNTGMKEVEAKQNS